jgi:hypothetical protein
MVYLVALIAFFALAAIAVHYWYLSILIVLIAISPKVIRIILKKRYFSSEEFLRQKVEISSVVDAYNEIAQYVTEIRDEGKFDIGHSSTGEQAYLAETHNTSKYGYKRDRNVAEYSSRNVHNGSLQIVRNAAADPIKYLIKYFDIEATEPKLEEIESLGDSVSKLENAIKNLKDRKQVLLQQ